MDAGTATGAPATDIDGEPRPQGSAPDIGAGEYDAPCQLGIDKTVSQTHAHYGDVLTYTITLTNTTVITPLNVVLTDVLPTAVAYVAGSLAVSQGSAACTSGVVAWSGTLDPRAAASISLQTRTVAGLRLAVLLAIALMVGAGGTQALSAAALTPAGTAAARHPTHTSASGATPSAEDLQFEHLSLAQGLSQASVYCILQDRQGFLWFGTQDGLNRYDGYRFEVYRPRHLCWSSTSSPWWRCRDCSPILTTAIPCCGERATP